MVVIVVVAAVVVAWGEVDGGHPDFRFFEILRQGWGVQMHARFLTCGALGYVCTCGTR